MITRETFIYLPMPINFILDRIYNHNIDILEEESESFLDEKVIKFGLPSILCILLFIILWVLYIYGIILAFGCQEHLFVHILASIFAAPLYSIYIAVVGCEDISNFNILKNNRRSYI